MLEGLEIYENEQALAKMKAHEEAHPVANSKASEQAKDHIEDYIDYYMLFYRIEYTNLFTPLYNKYLTEYKLDQCKLLLEGRVYPDFQEHEFNDLVYESLDLLDFCIPYGNTVQDLSSFSEKEIKFQIEINTMFGSKETLDKFKKERFMPFLKKILENKLRVCLSDNENPIYPYLKLGKEKT